MQAHAERRWEGGALTMSDALDRHDVTLEKNMMQSISPLASTSICAMSADVQSAGRVSRRENRVCVRCVFVRVPISTRKASLSNCCRAFHPFCDWRAAVTCAILLPKASAKHKGSLWTEKNECNRIAFIRSRAMCATWVVNEGKMSLDMQVCVAHDVDRIVARSFSTTQHALFLLVGPIFHIAQAHHDHVAPSGNMDRASKDRWPVAHQSALVFILYLSR